MQSRENTPGPCNPDDIPPDHSLLTWERWVKNRQEQAKLLSQNTDRPPADLVMNLVDKVREEKERKIVLENAQLKKKPTTFRGTLWEPPIRLKQECPCKPVYEVHRTAVEMGRPPVIEHIGVPLLIQQTEKGLIGVPERRPCKELDATYKAYRDEREHKLKDKIKKIDPHRPTIDGLIVKGSKPLTVKKLTHLPEITVTSPDVLYSDVTTGIYALRINNTLIFKDIPGQELSQLRKIQEESCYERCTSWTYYFNVPIKKAGRSKLFLSNMGTVAIRYCWRKLRRPIPYIPEDIYKQVFFFNKNEDVLSPGQTKEVLFTFISDKPGIYSEFWELSPCNICFFDTLADKLVINLHADAVERVQQVTKKIEKLKRKISRKALWHMMKSIITQAVDKVTEIEPLIYPYHKYFIEADLFVMKNPVCFYHQTEVGKMKEFYAEMTPGKEWDLSIGTWRQAMMSKEFDDRMRYYELLRNSHRELLKPWYEGESLVKEKYRATKLLLGRLADKFDEEYERLSRLYLQNEGEDPPVGFSIIEFHTEPSIAGAIRNIFYIRIHDHVGQILETCAGVLSSLDLNRWIDFDFCRC